MKFDEEASARPLTLEQFASLGLPRCLAAATPPVVRAQFLPARSAAGERTLALAGKERNGTCAVTVCTTDHVPFARVLASSFLRQHPNVPIFVVVADWDGRSELAVAGANLLSGAAVAGALLGQLALKLSAIDLCCALKPYALLHLFRHTSAARLLYVDADIYVFAPLAKLLDSGATHRFVVTPHTLRPTPNPDRFWWEIPQLGSLAMAGVLNAGMFSLRCDDQALDFLETWRGLVTAPGASFVGGQLEQQSFNWITCFAEDVGILRDTAYNVAYWNLHDRLLRHRALDDEGDEARWTVDGHPLVAFHFSGFSAAERIRLSHFDTRHRLFTLPSVAALVSFYRQRLREQGADEPRSDYRFARFPSGVAIDDRMRRLFREHEVALRSPLDPWSEDGEKHYCQALLAPLPRTGSLLPLLLQAIYQDRPDLHAFPDVASSPETMVLWFSQNGIYETGYTELFDRHRSVLPTHDGASRLGAVRALAPHAFDGLSAPLGADRQHFLARLRAAGLGQQADELQAGNAEQQFYGCIEAVRRLVVERPDVRRAFPDFLEGDAEAFSRWLASEGVRVHFLPEHAAEVFRRCSDGRSLARVYADLSRRWQWMTQFPLALVGEGWRELLRVYLALAGNGVPFDLEDLLMYRWLMEERPWSGLALTLELPINVDRRPSSLTSEGQRQLLGHLLQRDQRFALALEVYRREQNTLRGRREEAIVQRCPPAALHGPRSVYELDPDRLQVDDRRVGRRRLAAEAHRATSGVNLFGYHRSPTGLGTMTDGLATAIGELGLPVQHNIIGCDGMDRELRSVDFVRNWEPGYDTNVFVSYPHMEDILLRSVPAHRVVERRNVAYLAWEQRDGNPLWAEVYAECDQVWALSDFAADCFERSLQRPVTTVPAVVDCASFPPPRGKRAVGLDPERFTFLYVFDVSSSIERKNPEGALRAFARAFAADDPVELVLRVSNWHRLDYRDRVEAFLRQLPPELSVRLLVGRLGRDELLGLLSASDCYVSLHRAEGFGYTCAEAMAYERPVIASSYSGNLQFMSPQNSFLVECREVEVEVADGPFQRGSIWADPDVDHAAHLMRHVYRQRAQAAAVARQGRLDVLAQLSPQAVARILGGALCLEGIAAVSALDGARSVDPRRSAS